jgi:methylenetetrahydrofolate dehydrogenase (NADP+)/methenyltetrahydrofolate cyclohydrolase
MQILGRSDIDVIGKHCVVVGRSDIVGKPMAMMLAQKTGPLGKSNANATVTLVHSNTPDIAAWTRQADVLIVAIGKPRFITADMVRPGAVVIDVGINRDEDKIVGDVDYDTVSKVASAITPVPGGVGPLTIAMLLANTLAAARQFSSGA